MRFYIKYENTAFYGSPQYILDDESFFVSCGMTPIFQYIS